MLSHVMLGTNDLKRSTDFYDGLLSLFGAKRLMTNDRTVFWGNVAPQFGVCKPFDGHPANAGNGTMTALIAESRGLVADVYVRALALGATDEGAPGVRGDDPNGFFGAYFRDPDGNKICVYKYGPPETT